MRNAVFVTLLLASIAYGGYLHVDATSRIEAAERKVSLVQNRLREKNDTIEHLKVELNQLRTQAKRPANVEG